MSEVNMLGHFVWYELMTSDVEAAKRFYTKLMGWGTTAMDMGDMSYTMWTKGEAPVGGVMALPEEAKAAGAPFHWMTYISTPDVDATASQAAELGGTVLKAPEDIPTVGRFSVIADPQGAAFAAYKGKSDPEPSDDPPAPGDFSWHELATTDYEGAVDFYGKLFGWERTDAIDMGEGRMYQMFGRGGGGGGGGPPLGGMFNKTAEMPGPPAWLLYTMVDDVDRAAESVKALGGQVLNGPMEVPGGDRVVQCMDPQGVAFAMHSTAG